MAPLSIIQEQPAPLPETMQRPHGKASCKTPYKVILASIKTYLTFLKVCRHRARVKFQHGTVLIVEAKELFTKILQYLGELGNECSRSANIMRDGVPTLGRGIGLQ